MLNGYIKKNGELVRINPNNYTLGTGRVVSFTSGQWVEDGGRYKLVLPKSVSGANAIYELQTDGAYAKVILDTELTETNTILYSEAGFDGYCILGGNIVLSVDSVGREISSQLDALSDGKLDKSGGTLTGAYLQRDSDDSHISVFGGTTWNKGARLILNGKDNSSGGFDLCSHDGTNEGKLQGKADGTLTWAGKEVERVTASGTDYIRYENGLQICWGVKNNDNSLGTGYTIVTFPVEFANVPITLCSNRNSAQYNSSPCFEKQNGTTTTVVVGTTLNNSFTTNPATFYWLAIGRWK